MALIFLRKSWRVTCPVHSLVRMLVAWCSLLVMMRNNFWLGMCGSTCEILLCLGKCTHRLAHLGYMPHFRFALRVATLAGSHLHRSLGRSEQVDWLPLQPPMSAHLLPGTFAWPGTHSMCTRMRGCTCCSTLSATWISFTRYCSGCCSWFVRVAIAA